MKGAAFERAASAVIRDCLRRKYLLHDNERRKDLCFSRSHSKSSNLFFCSVIGQRRNLLVQGAIRKICVF